LSTHSLRHAVDIKADSGKVHEALTTLLGLKGWTGAEVSGDGKVGAQWTLKYPGGPTFVWQIAEHGAEKVVWKCVSGPGDSAGTSVTFDLGKTPHGRVHLAFAHSGWPHQQGNFEKCNALWGMMLHQLRAFAEQGKVAPALS
jgi:uncharacterized protein YndB with AHSA1/START domain